MIGSRSPASVVRVVAVVVGAAVEGGAVPGGASPAVVVLEVARPAVLGARLEPVEGVVRLVPVVVVEVLVGARLAVVRLAVVRPAGVKAAVGVGVRAAAASQAVVGVTQARAMQVREQARRPVQRLRAVREKAMQVRGKAVMAAAHPAKAGWASPRARHLPLPQA